jgi:hypothetical protein
MKLLRITALTTTLMTAAAISITSPAQAQARLAWWGWPGLVTAPVTGNSYATAYGYAPTYSYATGWSYPGYGQYQSYSSSAGYGMWNNPWYNPFVRRLPARLARAARHWQ